MYSIDLGENGELLVLMKRWRTLESIGISVPVITPEAAVEKLKRGETYTKLQSPRNVLINDIRLGYYEKPGKIREIILEPVWIFKNANEPVFEFPVYARQFASFTETPAAGKAAAGKDTLTVTFTDTSDASPTRWLWDFGDSITSTEQNPTHTYKGAGTYNVTLTTWNDLGSDTVVKPFTITGNTALPVTTEIATSPTRDIALVNTTITPVLTISPAEASLNTSNSTNGIVQVTVPIDMSVSNATSKSNVTGS